MSQFIDGIVDKGKLLCSAYYAVHIMLYILYSIPAGKHVVLCIYHIHI